MKFHRTNYRKILTAGQGERRLWVRGCNQIAAHAQKSVTGPLILVATLIIIISTDVKLQVLFRCV